MLKSIYKTMKTLNVLNFSEGTQTYIYIYVIPLHWYGTGSWKFFLE